MKVNEYRVMAIIIVVLLLAFCAAAFGQEKQLPTIEQQGNVFIQKSSSRGTYTKTKYVYQDSKGNQDTICISSTGKAFVFRVSKKTGRVWRKYLPEITNRLNQRKTEHEHERSVHNQD
jgi:hypothetical protein